MNALVKLSATDLRTLARAAQAGQLAEFSPLAVGRYITDPEPVASALKKLASSGGAVAPTLELLADAAANRPTIEDAAQLVVTGPDDGASRLTPVVVRQLFRNAVDSVWVCGYRPYDAKEIFRDLARPGLRVRMLLDIGEAKGTEEQTVELFLSNFQKRHWPEGQPLPEIWYDPKAIVPDANERAVAHAKCVVADCRWLYVSSANFTEAALTRNLEAGLLIESPQLARQMVSFLEGLIDDARVRRAVPTSNSKVHTVS